MCRRCCFALGLLFVLFFFRSFVIFFITDTFYYFSAPTFEMKKETLQPNQTKPNQTKPNQTKTKPNQTKPNQTKSNQTKPKQTKPNQTKPKPNQTKPNKPNQTKPNQNQTKPTGRPSIPVLLTERPVTFLVFSASVVGPAMHAVAIPTNVSDCRCGCCCWFRHLCYCFVIIASVVFTHCVFDVGCDVYVLFILLLLSLVFLQFSWV